jgi:Mn-dependent DtxR family transcriptional regulator
MSYSCRYPPRQAACFSTIADLLERRISPTARRIAFEMLLRDAGSVTPYLVGLERRGLLKRAVTSRGAVRLTKKGRSLAWGDGS